MELKLYSQTKTEERIPQGFKRIGDLNKMMHPYRTKNIKASDVS